MSLERERRCDVTYVRGGGDLRQYRCVRADHRHAVAFCWMVADDGSAAILSSSGRELPADPEEAAALPALAATWCHHGMRRVTCLDCVAVATAPDVHPTVAAWRENGRPGAHVIRDQSGNGRHLTVPHTGAPLCLHNATHSVRIHSQIFCGDCRQYIMPATADLLLQDTCTHPGSATGEGTICGRCIRCGAACGPYAHWAKDKTTQVALDAARAAGTAWPAPMVADGPYTPTLAREACAKAVSGAGVASGSSGADEGRQSHPRATALEALAEAVLLPAAIEYAKALWREATHGRGYVQWDTVPNDPDVVVTMVFRCGDWQWEAAPMLEPDEGDVRWGVHDVIQRYAVDMLAGARAGR